MALQAGPKCFYLSRWSRVSLHMFLVNRPAVNVKNIAGENVDSPKIRVRKRLALISIPAQNYKTMVFLKQNSPL